MARGLTKLPPISYDLVDRISLLKLAIKHIKETEVTADHLAQEIKLFDLRGNK